MKNKNSWSQIFMHLLYVIQCAKYSEESKTEQNTGVFLKKPRHERGREKRKYVNNYNLRSKSIGTINGKDKVSNFWHIKCCL